jgi:hypothetical protein
MKLGPEGDTAGNRERQGDGAEACHVLLLDLAVDAAGFGERQLEAPSGGTKTDKHCSGNDKWRD